MEAIIIAFVSFFWGPGGLWWLTQPQAESAGMSRLRQVAECAEEVAFHQLSLWLIVMVFSCMFVSEHAKMATWFVFILCTNLIAMVIAVKYPHWHVYTISHLILYTVGIHSPIYLIWACASTPSFESYMCTLMAYVCFTTTCFAGLRLNPNPGHAMNGDLSTTL